MVSSGTSIRCENEPLKPSNTGWLIADVVRDTAAFGWSRTQVDPALPRLLGDPQWAPCLVFPGEFAAPARVITKVPKVADKRPLFVLLNGPWSQARKMFRKSPYLDHLPVLSLQPEQLSRYRLRRSIWRMRRIGACVHGYPQTLGPRLLDKPIDVPVLGLAFGASFFTPLFTLLRLLGHPPAHGSQIVFGKGELQQQLVGVKAPLRLGCKARHRIGVIQA